LSKPKISVNQKALELVDKLVKNSDEYNVAVKNSKSGATVIDAGIKTNGGFQAGKIITEICLGGCGKVQIYPIQYDELVLPSIFVHTNYPAVSTLGSQFADWQIKQGDYSAIGSGPARALARKNRELYEEIDYQDEADATVLVLETTSDPPESVIEKVAEDCGVTSNRLSLILVPTTSIAGSTQVSGRIVETGLHKLSKVGLDPKKAINAFGSAPIAPVHPKFAVAMGRTNDAILYGGFAHYDVKGYSDDKLEQIVKKAPSSASKSYGQPFQQIFKSVNYDFYKIDPNLFAPAAISTCNLDTGSFFRAGEINIEILKRSIGLKKS
jgi:methenyltetrahydromethanopterin cyclohydrolase